MNYKIKYQNMNRIINNNRINYCFKKINLMNRINSIKIRLIKQIKLMKT